MSLWRKRGTSDTVATDVHHNEQKPDHLVNIVTNLSIKREKVMREVQRLGQEIEQEPVAWMDEDGDVLSASIVDGKGLRNIPLYTTPPKLKPLTGWQPIETAPRDGTEILMTNGVNVSSGQWFSEYGGTYDQEGAPNGDGCDDGWSDWSGGMQPDPTHWMPLPSPPIEAAHGIKDKNTRGKE